MSIVLYHGGAAANSLKALLPLFEKNVDFKSHLMALVNFEQHEPWFVKINPLGQVPVLVHGDRKSTRLNSSHLGISYAVFCLKKKKKNKIPDNILYQKHCTHRQ